MRADLHSMGDVINHGYRGTLLIFPGCVGLGASAFCRIAVERGALSLSRRLNNKPRLRRATAPRPLLHKCLQIL
jgi:hypothetical protein